MSTAKGRWAMKYGLQGDDSTASGFIGMIPTPFTLNLKPDVEDTMCDKCQVYGGDCDPAAVDNDDKYVEHITLERSANKWFNDETCEGIPGEPAILVWHRKCFEQKYGIKLPT